MYVSLSQGYGMVSHCVILLVGHFTHYSHGLFYLLWAVVAGASAARMVRNPSGVPLNLIVFW